VAGSSRSPRCTLHSAREEILCAFEACAVRKGLAETTLSDVAAEAGLPRSLARYFVGNRDDIVELLIERMVARAESSLEVISRGSGNLEARVAVDCLFDKVLADDTSNALVGELWYLARRDEHARTALSTVYARLSKGLASMLRRDPRVSAPKKEVESVAFSLLALAFGEGSLRALGVNDVPSSRVRAQAYHLVDVLTAAVTKGTTP
jgi:AcrR family transcriptional regulator